MSGTPNDAPQMPASPMQAIARQVLALDAQTRALQASIDSILASIGDEIARESRLRPDTPRATTSSPDTATVDVLPPLPVMPATFGGRGQFKTGGTNDGHEQEHERHGFDAGAGLAPDERDGRRYVSRDDIIARAGR